MPAVSIPTEQAHLHRGRLWELAGRCTGLPVQVQENEPGGRQEMTKIHCMDYKIMRGEMNPPAIRALARRENPSR